MKFFYYFFFSLLALILIFLLILGVALPTYHKYSFSYQMEKVMQSTWIEKTAIRQYYFSHKKFAVDNHELGLDKYGAKNEYMKGAVTNNGVIVLQLSKEVVSQYKGSLIIMLPEIKNDNIYWVCSSPNKKIEQNLIDKYC